MSRVQIDGAFSVDVEPQGIPHHHHANAAHAASGALGSRLSGKLKLNELDSRRLPHKGISAAQAENALKQLFDASPNGVDKPSLPDLLQMDPMVLSMMMTQLVLSVSGSNAQALCKQLERATEVQNFLRDKQVKEYQDQIQKAIEQAEKARKAGIIGAVFDWIIGGVEAIVGILKVVEGVMTGNALDVADGAAYFAAGIAGMVKAGAETALLLGADKSSCQAIINGANIAQLSCEGVALALDVAQIGRAFNAARAVTSATEKVLDSGVSKEILDTVVKAAEGAAEEELKVLAQEVGEAVGKKLGQDFGMAVEREMVEVGDMAIEANGRAIEAEANMVKDMGKSFTRSGVETIVKDAVEAGAKSLLKKGEQLTEEKLRDAILAKLRNKIMRTVVTDCSNKTLQVIRATSKGAEGISYGVVALQTAEIRKTIEQLIAQQNFIDFMENWTEDRKNTQQKRLQENYQNSTAALKSAVEMIDQYGSVLANIASGRA